MAEANLEARTERRLMPMLKVASLVVTGLVALLASVSPASAIAIYSNANGDGTVNTLLCGGGPCVNIDPRPSPWAPVVGDPSTSDGRQWVSDSQTGTFSSGVLDAPDLNTPSLVYTYTISGLTVPTLLDLSIWADDTARVSIDGTEIIAPSAGPYPTCSTTAIGCQVGTEGTISAFLLTAGSDHTITFDVFQAGGDNTPFGLMFDGELTPIPEPATILLLGSALAAAGIASRRRLAQKGQQQ
jgi:hypothetical protein